MAHDILPSAGSLPVSHTHSTDILAAERLVSLSRRLLELRRATVLVQREIDAITRQLGIE